MNQYTISAAQLEVIMKALRIAEQEFRYRSVAKHTYAEDTRKHFEKQVLEFTTIRKQLEGLS